MVEASVSVSRRVLTRVERVVKILRRAAVDPVLAELGLGLPVLHREADQCGRHTNQKNNKDNLCSTCRLVVSSRQLAAVGRIIIHRFSC